MLKVIVEVPDGVFQEEDACDRIQVQVREWLESADPVLVLPGMKAHVFEFEPRKGALIDTQGATHA